MKSILVTLAVSFTLVTAANAVSRKEFSAARPAALAPGYQNDGDVVVPFSVQSTSASWTVVVSSRAVRRSLYIHGLDSNAMGVCLSTTSTAAIACDDSAAGVEFSTGTALTPGLREHRFYTEAAIYVRNRAGDTYPRPRVKGYETYDSED